MEKIIAILHCLMMAEFTPVERPPWMFISDDMVFRSEPMRAITTL